MLKLEAVGQSYDHDHDCLQSTHRQKRHFHLPTSHTFTQLVADAVNTTVTRQWFQLVRIETQPERNGIQRSSTQSHRKNVMPSFLRHLSVRRDGSANIMSQLKNYTAYLLCAILWMSAL